ncbi:MAG: putative transcriptional regulator [Deltaproteobacteria bacterium]|jgi:DNA-binding transcriptional MerR regulator|nr:putative transcriptional regulator [Deltaproteobacteria bacterium]
MQVLEEKKFFRIGEVSRIIGVEPYVLRYWESEFPQIRPVRADTNQRTYQKKDLELIMEIKRLLYEEKLTIEGARQRLKQKKERTAVADAGLIEDVKADLQAILKTLS